MYDLVIGLRVYPGISKEPILKGSKLETFTQVYKSILDGIGGINVKLIVFSDGCNDDFHSMMEKFKSPMIDLEIKKIDCFSNIKSFRIQYEYLSLCDSKLVALIEDDYLIQKGALETIFKYAKSINFKGYYTFFNSSDYYDHYLHNYKSNINYDNGVYWRTVASTTLTFICSPATLKNNRVVFSTYFAGNFDHNIWILLTKIGRWQLLISVFKNPNLNNFKRTSKFILAYFLLFPYIAFKRENLWVCIPGKGTHLETLGVSHEYKEFE